MKAHATILFAVWVIFSLVFGFNTFAQESVPNPASPSYAHLLDKYVARCEAKIEMRNSGLDNIRRAAAVAMLKGTFAKTYRKELISGMVEEEVDPKTHKVDLYLNDRFYSLVRSQGASAEKL